MKKTPEPITRTKGPITKDTLLTEAPERFRLGTRSNRVLEVLGIQTIGELRKLNKDKVLAMKGTGITTWTELMDFRVAVADHVTSNGKAEAPKAEETVARAKPNGDRRATFKAVAKEAKMAGLVCFEEMFHEHEDGEDDEVSLLVVDPFAIASVELGQNTHPMIHYVIGGQMLSAKVNHPMQVIIKWIAEARQAAYTTQNIRRGAD